MKRVLILVVGICMSTFTYAQMSGDSLTYLDELNEIEVKAEKTVYSLSDEVIPQRVEDFATKKEQIANDLIMFEKSISGSNEKRMLSSTGSIKPSIFVNYQSVKTNAKSFCLAVQDEIALAINSCDCLSKTRLEYISNLNKMKIQVMKQTQKVDDTIARKLKGA